LLKHASTKRLGTTPFVQIQAAAAGWDSVLGIDGVTCVVPPMKLESGTPYPRFGESTFSQLARAGKPVSPCMLQNFDERPRQDILIADRKRIRYLTGKTDSLFRQNLLATKQFSDAAYESGKHPASRIIYLYAWNEWHEGGILEPNVLSGARDLNIVTDVFQLPRSLSPCLDHGAC
jgi:Glycosyltransferase WbsX